MAEYRIITKHVRYWRGNIHRWSNSYSFLGTAAAPTSTDLTTLTTQESKMMVSPASGNSGGCYGAVAYNKSGGAPISFVDFFDPDTPASWIKYTGTGWASPPTQFESAAEVALLVEWPAGLSSSGKPVNFRKWYHAVPTSVANGAGTVDVSSTNVTSLTAQAVVLTNCLASSHLLLATGARYAGTPVVQPYYANHQMPKGRKRKALVTASGRYTGPSIQVPDQIVVD